MQTHPLCRSILANKVGQTKFTVYRHINYFACGQQSLFRFHTSPTDTFSMITRDKTLTVFTSMVSFSFLSKGGKNEIVWIIGGASTYSCAKHGAHNLVESGTFFAQA